MATPLNAIVLLKNILQNYAIISWLSHFLTSDKFPFSSSLTPPFLPGPVLPTLDNILLFLMGDGDAEQSWNWQTYGAQIQVKLQ